MGSNPTPGIPSNTRAFGGGRRWATHLGWPVIISLARSGLRSPIGRPPLTAPLWSDPPRESRRRMDQSAGCKGMFIKARLDTPVIYADRIHRLRDT